MKRLAGMHTAVMTSGLEVESPGLVSWLAASCYHFSTVMATSGTAVLPIPESQVCIITAKWERKL